MMWSAKAVFTEHESGIQGVARACADHGLRIRDLRQRSGWNGQVVHEIVLSSPDGWTGAAVSALLREAGAATVRAARISDLHPEAHVDAERKARLAHPGGTRRAWRGMRAAG